MNLRQDGKVKTVTVHRCVLLAHAGSPPADKPFSRHHPNDDPADNRWPENLSWCDATTNEADKLERQRRAGYVPTPQERRDAVTVAQRDTVTPKQPVVEVSSAARRPRLRRLRARLRRWWDGAA